MSGELLPARRRAALETVRSVLAALVVVALLGSLAAVLSYRADVGEARRQVRERVTRQGSLYSDALSLHFELLRTELQRLADRGFTTLAARDTAVRAGIHDDRALFSGGVGFFDRDGHELWSEPNFTVASPVTQPWFREVLAFDRATVDELVGDDTSRVAVALPVHDGAELKGILVGVVHATDQLLYGAGKMGEQLLLLASNERVVLPLTEPAWSHASDFDDKYEALRSSGGLASWTIDGSEVLAEGFAVRGTALQVLALESEDTAIAPIRRRFELQLGFLLLVQLTALGAFVIFLRRTWRAFLDAELQLAEQEKMAALGAAASLIAHEVKNSLNGLKAANSLLTAGGDVALVTRTVDGQVERLSHLSRSLLSFSKPDQLRRVPVEFDAVVRDAIAALATLPEWPEAKVELALGSGATVSTDPLLLATAVDNLARNAIEAAVAAKDTGRVLTPVVRVETLRDGARVVFKVTDNGVAPEGFEARLGEPFFTTKAKGIGLGLAMTLRAVEQLGGALRFVRGADGSCFELSLPGGVG